MTTPTHESNTAPLLHEGALRWTAAYIALTTLIIVGGGSIALTLVTTIVPGLVPAGALLLVMLAVVAISPTLAKATLQTIYTRRHHGQDPIHTHEPSN